MEPRKIEAVCRIVTPMLAFGADHRVFELRATEVKAGLRFWWRAFQALEPKELFKAERLLFGNAADASSAFHLSVREEGEIPLWKPGEDVTSDWGPGIGYILFPIVNPGKTTLAIKPADDDPGKSGRPVAKPGGRFTVSLRFTRQLEPARIGDVLCALWLLENLGGLGGRTRRGAGCFKIETLTIDSADMETARASGGNGGLEWETIPSLGAAGGGPPEQSLREGLERIMKRWNTARRAAPPEYTAYHPELSQVVVLYGDPPLDSAVEVMKRIGQRMKSFSSGYPSQESEKLRTALEKATPLPPDFQLTKAARGLPITFQYGDPPGSLSFTATSVACDSQRNPLCEAGAYKAGSGRRASPLLISCHEGPGNPYAVLCLFPAPLLKTNEKIWLKPSKEPKALNAFIDCPSFGFVEDLVFGEKKAVKRQEEAKPQEPILFGFDKRFRVLPNLEEITAGLRPSAPEGIAHKLARDVPAVRDLLARVDFLSGNDRNTIQAILDACARLASEGENAGVKQVAVALKAKLTALGLYGKKSAYRVDVETLLIELEDV